MRVSGATGWLSQRDWADFCAYEEAVNEAITRRPMMVLCSYPLTACGAAEVLDVARTHEFALAKRHGRWDVVEPSDLKQVKAELKRLNEELERRVEERTRQLTVANEELTKEVLERARAEEALRKSEERYALALRAANDGLWDWDLDRNEAYYSPRWKSMLGFEEGKIRGEYREWVTRIHPEDRDRVLAAVREHLAGRSASYECEYRMRHRDGSYRWVLARGRAERDPGGTVRRMVGSHTDITERRRAEEALRAAQAELAHASRVTTMGELVASIAHEVNQPLAAIVANGHACLRWLAQERPDPGEARAAVERVIRDGKRASDVIGRIRALSTRAAPQKTALDVNEVIRDVVALIRSEALQHRVVLRTDLSSALPPVHGDRVQLQQVILNLVVNGIEASESVTERPAELWIGSSRDDTGGVLVAVQDSGAGVDPAHMARIFEAFFTTKPGGMGMGLSISRSIAEAHGGRLWVTPNAGPGATFRFTLPAELAIAGRREGDRTSPRPPAYQASL